MYLDNVAIPLVHGVELAAKLADLLTKHQEDIATLLIPDLTHIDPTAHNVHGIKIERVAYLNGEQYQLDYCYDWEVYRGCSDICDTGVERQSVRFRVDSHGDVHITALVGAARGTLDEF